MPPLDPKWIADLERQAARWADKHADPGDAERKRRLENMLARAIEPRRLTRFSLKREGDGYL